MFLEYKLFFVSGFFVVFLVAQHFWAYRMPPLHNLFRIVKNYGLFVINIVGAQIIILPLTLMATQLNNYQGEGINFVCTNVILYDFFIYWMHRFFHELKFLWRFHFTHHSDEFYDISTGVRFHFGEVMISAFYRVGVVIATGMSMQSVLVCETMLLCFSLFSHANINIPPKIDRFLSYFIVTPGWHYLHHHAIRADTDSHYGNVLTIWDRIFRTRAQTAERTPTMVIGVSGEKDRSFWQLLVSPFKK